MKEQTISIKSIADELMLHPLLQDQQLETIAIYALEFLRIMGVPDMFTEKNEEIHIKDYRAKLPCDFYQMNQVRMKDNMYECFRYATDSFHYYHENAKDISDYTYKIQNNIIYTSIKEGDLIISYQAICVDDDGYPLLPDNASFIRALKAYIKVKAFTILFDLSKIPQNVLQNAQQEYAWAAGDCATEFNRMTIDEMQSLTNSWNTLIVRATSHRQGFLMDGARELIRNH